MDVSIYRVISSPAVSLLLQCVTFYVTNESHLASSQYPSQAVHWGHEECHNHRNCHRLPHSAEKVQQEPERAQPVRVPVRVPVPGQVPEQVQERWALPSVRVPCSSEQWMCQQRCCRSSCSSWWWQPSSAGP